MTAIDFSRPQTWAFDEALPLWAERGVDRAYGGFEEELDLEGRAVSVDFKRTRVAGRQIYVFAHAALLGWTQGAQIADEGVRFLTKSAWLGPAKGWARLVARDGRVLDPTPDLYDLAFVLFGLAWHHRLTGHSRSRELALETIRFIRSRMRRDGAFVHEFSGSGDHQQNPHMHLLEASIASAESFGDEVFIETANELVVLFRGRFFNGETLAESFDDRWERSSNIVEPGHQMEWAWILGAYSKLVGVDVHDDAVALVRFAERFGVHPESSLTLNQVREDGSIVDAGSRTWPNTERIKAHLALFEMGGAQPSAAVNTSLDALFRHHLGQAPRGLWLERFDEMGRSNSRSSPASTLYHVFLAFTEILRLKPALERNP
ncbi:MAG: AGE family epimerase/isomerase [Terricaulis sp.]